MALKYEFKLLEQEMQTLYYFFLLAQPISSSLNLPLLLLKVLIHTREIYTHFLPAVHHHTPHTTLCLKAIANSDFVKIQGDEHYGKTLLTSWPPSIPPHLHGCNS